MLDPKEIKASEESPVLPNPNKNLRVRIYHQVPRCFTNLKEIRQHLLEIAHMKFTHVWISPIQDTEKESYGVAKFNEPELQRQLYKNPFAPIIYSGSLYSMRKDTKFDDDFSLDVEANRNSDHYIPTDVEEIKAYTKQACDLGITPIFDLVVNQVSKESPLWITHPYWFRSKGPFGQGCAHFNYDGDMKIKEEIIEFWKAYITRYIENFGFQGVRVDAIKHIPSDVQERLYEHIYQECWRVHKKYPVIFAEAFLGNWETVEGLHGKVTSNSSRAIDYISHITNFLHWEQTNPKERHQNWKHVYDYLGELNQFGGNVGFPGCHDQFSLHDAVCYNASDIKFIAQRIRNEGDSRSVNNIESDLGPSHK
jgi:glycosidase